MDDKLKIIKDPGAFEFYSITENILRVDFHMLSFCSLLL